MQVVMVNNVRMKVVMVNGASMQVVMHADSHG